MYNEALIRDSIIKKTLQAQGIKGLDFDRLKLYHYDTYNKAVMQYSICKSVGIGLFKKSIQKKGSYRV